MARAEASGTLGNLEVRGPNTVRGTSSRVARTYLISCADPQLDSEYLWLDSPKPASSASTGALDRERRGFAVALESSLLLSQQEEE